jgi:hypothetical protein
MFGLAVLTDDSLGFGRGGGGRGGGFSGGGGGFRGGSIGGGNIGGGGFGGARPSPSPAPSRPTPASRPSTLPSKGGSVIGPIGGAHPGKDDGPNFGGGKLGGGPVQLPSRPGGGDFGKGILNPGGGGLRPDGGRLPDRGDFGNRFPSDGGLANYAKNARIGNTFVNNGTINVNRNTLVAQGNNVRTGFQHYDCFHPNSWGRYPTAWRAAGWTSAAAVWATATWARCASYCSYPAQPVYYDYGSSVVYEGDNVYQNGEPVATQDQYAQQAAAIADTGRQAQAAQKDDWLTLGVFGMVQGGESSANILFQLAVNKAGVIRGNYYDALSDTTLPVYGQVDQKTQRAAWTVGDKKNIVYEAGFANLTKDETTMLVHFGKDRTQQWNLVRLQQPGGSK